MREKIQRAILQYISASKAQMIHSHDDVFLTDKILTLICEEIEKKENPYPGDRYHVAQRIAYEEACQDILTLLRSEKGEQ